MRYHARSPAPHDALPVGYQSGQGCARRPPRGISVRAGRAQATQAAAEPRRLRRALAAALLSRGRCLA